MTATKHPGGELEYAVLSAVWEAAGAVSARDIFDQVGRPRGLVYTTTATILDRLHAKGLVVRRKVGKTFLYRAKVERERIDRERAVIAVAQILGGPRPALAALVDAVEAFDPTLLAELERLASMRQRRNRGS